MRMRIPLLSFALVLLSGLLRADELEDRVAATLSKNGAVIERDRTQPGRPVVGVIFVLTEKVTTADLEALATFKKLRLLSLNQQKITDAELAGLRGLRTLQQLDLSMTSITDPGLKEVASLKDLRELWLIGTSVTDTGVKELGNLIHLHFSTLTGQVSPMRVRMFSPS